jgi:4-hydroxyphenylacetate 3-monooxygenase
VGLARTITTMNGVHHLPPVQAQVADMAVDAATYEGLIDAQIARAAPNRNGVFVPHRQSHYAAMSLQSQIYPRVLETLRELSGGGMIQLPASADDLMSEAAGADLRRYVQSPEVTAEARVKLLKLAWDAVG